MTHRFVISAMLVALLATAAPASAQLFGPSDDEVAAQKAHEDSQDAKIQQNAQDLQQAQAQSQAQLRDLSDRVRSLTDSLARATGANEELSHQIAVLNDKIDRQEKDFSYRLCTLSAQQLGADAGGLNCAAAGTQSAGRPAPGQQIAPGAALAPLGGNGGGDDGSPQRGRPPGNLGQLSSSGPQAFAPAPAGGGAGSSRQFDAAMNLLAKAQYAEAAAGFRAYADSHADDTNLAPQALYWVGNIAYVQQDYAGAARALAEQIKKYPTSTRTPDSMLKLGQSLIAQGQTSGGCTALAQITAKKYPDAQASTLASATAARKVSCR